MGLELSPRPGTAQSGFVDPGVHTPLPEGAPGGAPVGCVWLVGLTGTVGLLGPVELIGPVGWL